MQSRLERRVFAIERKRARSIAEHSDAELLALMGWKGRSPPTDEELQAIADRNKGGQHVVTH